MSLIDVNKLEFLMKLDIVICYLLSDKAETMYFSNF